MNSGDCNMNKTMIKKSIKKYIDVVGSYIHKYIKMIIFAQILFLLISIWFIIYWNFDEVSVGEVGDYVYLYSHIFSATISSIMLLLLFLTKYNKINNKQIVIATNIYAILLLAWSTILCTLDLTIGYDPIIYVFISTLISGLFVIHPLLFILISLSSLIVILIIDFKNIYQYVVDKFYIEAVIDFLAFILINCVIAYRHYMVTKREYESLKRLEELSYIDELTGLCNERSYLNEIDEVNKKLEEDPSFKYAVMMMDVNNLKNTNDKYGHRYGCHLIIRCGHVLPEIFKTSKLFHVGGDEFIAIIYGDDYDNFEEKIKEYDDKLTYSIVNYEDVDLIFSVARGYAVHTDEKTFRDLLQKADTLMYENKEMLKEKYNIKSR